VGEGVASSEFLDRGIDGDVPGFAGRDGCNGGLVFPVDVTDARDGVAF